MDDDRSILASVFVHVALDGVMDGALGLGLDVVDTAARLTKAGAAKVRLRPRALTQKVVSHDGAPVRSMNHRSVSVDGPLEPRALRAGDVLVLPGVITTDEAGVARLLARPDARRVIATLPRLAARGVLIAASCAATFLAAEAGLLDATAATTTWWLVPSFTRRFPTTRLRADRMVVDAGGVLTAGAAFAHADLMIAAVARVAGPTLAARTARALVLDARPSQSRYMVVEHLRTLDPMLLSLEEHVSANLTRQLPLAELAQAARTSPRTLARRVAAALGTTPQRFVQRVRVQHAIALLETTRASVEEVAVAVGYRDTAAFRRVLRSHTGTSPRGLRAVLAEDGR